MADVVILSIDESSFKQEGMPSRYWQASSKTIKKLYSLAGHEPRQQIFDEETK